MDTASWKERLTRFQPPSELLSIVRNMAAVPNDRFFNDPVYKPLHEAWAAGHFVLGLEHLYANPAEVRLETNEFPDFCVRFSGGEYEFEFTSVDKPERRRGLEYKKRAKNPLIITPYQPGRGRQEGPNWIARAVQKKRLKNYSTSPHLLIYANFEADALEPQELAAACHEWEGLFRSIWVLWDYQIVQLYNSHAFGPAHTIWCSVGVNPWTEKSVASSGEDSHQ